MGATLDGGRVTLRNTSSNAASILVFHKDQLDPDNSGTDPKSNLHTIVLPEENPLVVFMDASSIIPGFSPCGSMFFSHSRLLTCRPNSSKNPHHLRVDDSNTYNEKRQSTH
eukprot:scaffold27_cov394-Pavlova_lutheri.AAC.4